MLAQPAIPYVACVLLAGSGIEYAENPDDALYVAFTHGTHSVLNDAPEPKIAAMWTHSLHHRFTLVALTKIEDRRRAAEASGNTTWADDPQTAQLLRAVQALTAPPSNGYVYRLVLRPERVHVKDVVPRRYLHRALDDVYYRRGTRVLSRDFGEACFLELDERGFVVVRTADGSEPDPLQVQTLRAAIIDDDENYYQLPDRPCTARSCEVAARGGVADECGCTDVFGNTTYETELQAKSQNTGPIRPPVTLLNAA